MKVLIAAIAISVSVIPAAAQWEPHPEVLVIDAQGAGSWALTCQLQDKKGATVSQELRGTGKKPQRLTMLDARGGQCSYQAAPDQPLTLQMRRGLYACSLPTATRKGCEQKVEAGASGQFDIRWLG